VRPRSRRSLLAVILLGSGCSREKPEPPGEIKEYRLRGVVRHLEPKYKVAVIQHDKIEGWMESMTMEFPVRDDAEYAKLRVGAAITARVRQRQSDMDYWIDQIEPAPPAKSTP